ncbi:Conserved_hypothetical protein [Hexamita inflata]|uniref:RING-type domain-containing protein n=1 Tax=Hexamita inflata TaxID=28002 RepID=A0AA86NDP8_9EUKA|nr:Conserved hypothetical protein [Hexamita inflata]CAI9941240.1 Conserved hypothetical protein [Hexamita inflata]
MTTVQNIYTKYASVIPGKYHFSNLLDYVSMQLFQRKYSEDYSDNLALTYYLENTLQSPTLQLFLPQLDHVQIGLQLQPAFPEECKSFMCKSCNNLMTQCVVSDCGCHFCLTCAYHSENCPICNRSIHILQQSPLQNTVQKQQFKCPYSSCNIEGSYQQMLEHSLTCQFAQHELETNQYLLYSLFSYKTDQLTHLQKFVNEFTTNKPWELPSFAPEDMPSIQPPEMSPTNNFGSEEQKRVMGENVRMAEQINELQEMNKHQQNVSTIDRSTINSRCRMISCSRAISNCRTIWPRIKYNQQPRNRKQQN